MLHEIKISIIIPIYNVENYIQKCVDSALSQTYRNLEIILVNDGATDKSSEIINNYTDNRIKVINKINRGLSSARNFGIRNATGEYIFHLDGDDYIEKDTIELLTQAAIRNKADVVIGDIKLVFENNKQKIWKDSHLDQNMVIEGKTYLKEHYFGGEGTNSVCNKLWKRKLYIENNIRHPEEISLGEDGATTPRLLLNAKRVCKLDKIVYNYRINLSSMTQKKNKKILEYKKAIKIVESFFEECNELNFFLDYKTVFSYKLFYTEIFTQPYTIAKRENLKDYIIAWEDFFLNTQKILYDKNTAKIISKKRKILIFFYHINPKLADLILIFSKKILSL